MTKTSKSRRTIALDPATVAAMRAHRAFQEQVERVGLPRIRLHDLRHTWATLALQAGIHPKIVSERLGHANQPLTATDRVR